MRLQDMVPPETEKQIQSSMITWLHLNQIEVLEFGKPGGRPRCAHCGTVVGRLAGALPPGWHDLLIILPEPVYIHVEVKSATGKLSDDQRALQVLLARLGCHSYQAKSLVELEQIVRRHGAVVRVGAA